MTTYPDTSLLVSLYLGDNNSQLADRMLRGAKLCLLTPLHRIEWFHAMGQNVFRGVITESSANELHGLLEQDTKSGLWREAPMPDHVFDVCADLARRYGPKLGVRTLDSLHVACAMELKADHFCTFDERQAKLAKAQGLNIS